VLAHLPPDTIDLQDQTSPSAQDHSRKPAQLAPLSQAVSTAPHQAAELRHAQHERAAEEMALNRQWSGMQGLSDEPPSEEEDMFVHGHSIDDGSLVQQNGHVDDGDAINGDDDMDDDGMDKISSSPSITDGRYSPCVWPRRVSSLTSASSPLASPGREASAVNPSPFSSSPLACTPSSHGSSECLSETMSPFAAHETSPAHCRSDLSSSSSGSPDSLTLFLQRHHHWGECGESDVHRLRSFSRLALADSEIDSADEARDRPGRPFSDSRPLSSSPSLERSVSTPDLQDLQFHAPPIHVPADGEAKLPYGSERELAASLMDDNCSDDSDWTTDSDTDDSFDSFAFNDDDAKSFLSIDDRFICSGWGIACLQEVEDIDFEFVYALHNFVATVEGQANAAKGDTMVLLDDSNSYWWLVRVVKDSTIGWYSASGGPKLTSPGYLPAEHIETPTERLARLNKHRNIDVSGPPLADPADVAGLQNDVRRLPREGNAKSPEAGHEKAGPKASGLCRTYVPRRSAVRLFFRGGGRGRGRRSSGGRPRRQRQRHGGRR
jgi:hypothetical protein